MAEQTRIFFAADIHGSERCFRKWLNAARATKANVLVFGGDLAGKILQPIVDLGAGRHATELYGQRIEVEGASGLEELVTRIRNAGRYELIVSADEKAALDASPERVHEAFLRVAIESASRWLELADARLREIGVPAYVMLGNDDFPELKGVFGASELVIDPEDRVVELPGGWRMASLGYSNPTPWHTARELEEPELGARLEAMMPGLPDPSAAIVTVHAPPIGTSLDRAARLDAELRPVTHGGQVEIASVGSTSVRAVLERHQPVLSLHGHIHESPGMARIGRTTAINPGSEYVDGILRGAIITLERGRGVRSWQLIQG
jgi:Icc-related predicted phosphoesterase